MSLRAEGYFRGEWAEALVPFSTEVTKVVDLKAAKLLSY